MKKKWLTILLSAICALVCAAFGACVTDDPHTGWEPNTESSSNDIYGPMSEITYETTEYLANVTGCNPQFEKAGVQVTIATHILLDVDLWVYANGERVEQVPYDAAWWGYVFTMPDEPVHITFEVVSASYLTEFEPWLAEVSADDIAQIKQSDEIAGIAPGNFIDHYTVTDSESIAQIFLGFQRMSMKMCQEDCFVTGGLSRTVTFTMKDGSVRTLSFYQGLYMPASFSSLTHFHVNTMPTLTAYSTAVKSYSFVTVSGNCDIFEIDYENGGQTVQQVGEGTFLADLEFVEYHGDVLDGDVPDYEPVHKPVYFIFAFYYIQGEYFEDEFRIYVQDKSLFYMWNRNGYGNGPVTYYQVLGDVDLLALIQDSLWENSVFTEEEIQVMYSYFGFVFPCLEGKAYTFDYTENYKYYKVYAVYTVSNCTSEEIEAFEKLCKESFTLVEEFGTADECDMVWYCIFMKDGVRLSLTYDVDGSYITFTAGIIAE